MKHKLCTSAATAVFVVSSWSLISAPALAQTGEPAPSESADDPGRGLEEVIVTAQKRQESLQDVPISITAITGAELTSSGVSSADNLSLVTPGLTYYRAGSAASPFIRGIGGISTSVGNEGSVATYVDGVYIRDMSILTQTFNNVERVEVLKGPQGTLFGRNATGGLIHTITKTPSHDPEMTMGLSIGNFQTVQGDLYGTVGITENLAADLSVAVRTQGEGVGVNRTTGREVGFDEYQQVRAKFLYTPSDETDITLTLQWGEIESDRGKTMACAPGFICATPVSPNFADIFHDRRDDTKGNSWLSALHVTHSFGSVDLASITSYQESDTDSYFDTDASPYFLQVVNLFPSAETFSQEFQLQSTYESAFQWIVGVFFWDDKSWWDPVTLATPTLTSRGESHFDTKSYAAFGQGYYNFTDATQLTVGLRWTRDDREQYGVSAFVHPVLGARVVAFQQEDTFEEPSWRLALSHQFNDRILGYVSYNRGFKSGSYNTFVATGVPDRATNPEIMDAYAIGMKSDVLDDRLRLNVELFFNEIDDLQLRKYNANGTTSYLNAAAGEIAGVDLSATALVTDNLTVQLGLSLLDSEYVDFPNCPVNTSSQAANGGRGGNIESIGNCTGKSMINAPESTVSLVLDHTLPLSNGRFDTNLTYAYNDGYFVVPINNFAHPSYSVLNASMAWVSEDERYEIGLYGSNLTDEEYASGLDSRSSGNVLPVGMFPREYGVRLKVSL